MCIRDRYERIKPTTRSVFHRSESGLTLNDSNIWVIIPAAGSGSRMQQVIPKQYLLLNDVAVIEHTLALFLDLSDFSSVRVCLAPDDTVFSTLKSSQHSKVSAIDGGDTRAQSVLNGLRSLDAADDDWVLVHDAARPCLSKKTLDSLLSEVKRNNIGCLLYTSPSPRDKRQSRMPSSA